MVAELWPAALPHDYFKGKNMPVDYEIEGRVAIVTGASSGLGLASAIGLASQGVNVLIVSRNEGKLKLACDQIKAISNVDVESYIGDVADETLAASVVAKAQEKWGRVDILVNNAGGPPMGSFLEHGVDVWREAISLTLMSVVSFSTAVAPIFMSQKWGRIVNISSSLAKEPSSAMVLSATARAGVSAFSKAISYELAPLGGTVNTVCPGGALTDRLRSLVEVGAKKSNKSFEQALQDSQLTIPLGRFAEPNEFADMVVFLCSERGKYITGTTVMVDGGLTKGTF